MGEDRRSRVKTAKGKTVEEEESDEETRIGEEGYGISSRCRELVLQMAPNLAPPRHRRRRRRRSCRQSSPTDLPTAGRGRRGKGRKGLRSLSRLLVVFLRSAIRSVGQCLRRRREVFAIEAGENGRAWRESWRNGE